jgi:hypothetical protein
MVTYTNCIITQYILQCIFVTIYAIRIKYKITSIAQNMYNIKFANGKRIFEPSNINYHFMKSLTFFFSAPTNHAVTWKIQKTFYKMFSDMFVQQIQFQFTSLDIIKHTTNYFNLSVKFHT